MEKDVKYKLSKPKIFAIIAVICIIAVGAGFGIKAIADRQNYNLAKDCITAQNVAVEYTGEENRISINDFISEAKENNITYTAKFADSEADEYTLVKESSVGEYDVKFIVELTGNMFFREIELDAKIILQDTTPPEWTKTTDSVTVLEGESIDIQSLFAAEDLSGEVTISAEGEINTDSAGTEKVKITAQDTYGNTSEYELNVTVDKKPSETSKNSGKSSESSTLSNSSQGNSKGNNNTSSSGGNTKPSSSGASGSSNSSSDSSSSTHQHSMPIGNIGMWFNSRSEVEKYVTSVRNEWGEKYDNGLITWDEYMKNVPSGYEAWSCSTCGKWTGNFKYN